MTGMTCPKPTCGHCGGVQDGYAAVGNTPLCHPDTGMDCFKLVTLYGHSTPCSTCKVATSLPSAGSELMSECQRCRQTLGRKPCGCWLGPDRTRWCPNAHDLHQPIGGTQPERCPGNPADVRRRRETS